MFRFSSLPLPWRLAFLVSCITFVSLLALASSLLWQSTSLVKTDAEEAARVLAYAEASSAEAILDDAMGIARYLSQFLQVAKKSDSGFEIGRDSVNAILKCMLEDHPEILGIYTCWEPNAFDGADRIFANKPGHDASGRFIPYWNRASGKVAVEPLVDYDKLGAGDYYLLPKKTGMETLINPYSYPVAGKEILMTSLVVPIKDANGKFLGIAGVDVELAALQKKLSSVTPYGTGYVELCSNNGLTVFHKNPSNIMKDMAQTERKKQTKEKIARGESDEFESFSQADQTKVFQIYAPVRVGGTSSPWSLGVIIPSKSIMAKVHSMLWMAVGIAGICIAVAIAISFFAAKKLISPVEAMIEHLSEAVDFTSGAAAQISDTSRQLAENSSNDAATLEESSSALEEISSMTETSEENSKHANATTVQARQLVEQGTGEMRKMSEAMDEVKTSSIEISKIIKTIDEIAFQTNILALNAAVEAARAGEAGAGFAVVADEVRNLAQRSAAASRETSEKIENSSKKTDQGVETSKSVEAVFAQIAEKTKLVDGLVAEITSASSDQKHGITQVAKSVSAMNETTQNAAASAEELASTAAELGSQTKTLQQVVADLVLFVRGVR